MSSIAAGDAAARTESPRRVYYARSVYGEAEMEAVRKVLASGMPSVGERTAEFERLVAALFGKQHGTMVNSGSSANLIALRLLDLEPGHEVITPALTFSTVVAPILQLGLKPVLVDSQPGSYLTNAAYVCERIGRRTGALMIPNLLGNVPDIRSIRLGFGEIPYIEDSCDTIGSTIEGAPTGDLTTISTTSFYGSHIITAAGGGGMLCVNGPVPNRRARLLRGWGRSSAADETEDPEVRFAGDVDGVPYDSKFIYEEIGYNFLPLEVSAAFGVEQLARLKEFALTRRYNFERLRRLFAPFEDYFYLPSQMPSVETNWLAFPLTIRDGSPFGRMELARRLEAEGIQTRPIFSGNILRQPAFKHALRSNFGREFPGADCVMRNGLLIGCHQGMDHSDLEHVEAVATDFLSAMRV